MLYGLLPNDEKEHDSVGQSRLRKQIIVDSKKQGMVGMTPFTEEKK